MRRVSSLFIVFLFLITSFAILKTSPVSPLTLEPTGYYELIEIVRDPPDTMIINSGDIVIYTVAMKGGIGEPPSESSLIIDTGLVDPLTDITINLLDNDFLDMQSTGGGYGCNLQLPCSRGSLFLPLGTETIQIEVSGYAPEVTETSTITGVEIFTTQTYAGETYLYSESSEEEGYLSISPSSPIEPTTKYDFIEYHTMAEGKEGFGDNDPINPKSMFFTGEENAVLVFAFNQLRGTVDLEFMFYKNDNFVSSRTDITTGDGTRWVHDINAYFADFPVSDVTGNWQIDTYIDEDYAFSDKFTIARIIETVPPTIKPTSPPFEPTTDEDLFGTMLGVDIIFYLLFIVPYIIVQKIRKKEIKSKSIIIGGTSILVFFVFILIPGTDGSITKEERIYIIFWAFLIITLIHFAGLKLQRKEKEEPKKEKPIIEPKLIEKEKKIELKPEIKTGPNKIPKKCPFCGGKISELNHYKLKSGNDVTCEYCGEIIEG